MTLMWGREGQAEGFCASRPFFLLSKPPNVPQKPNIPSHHCQIETLMPLEIRDLKWDRMLNRKKQYLPWRNSKKIMSIQQRNLASVWVSQTSGRKRYLICNPKTNEQITEMSKVDTRLLVLENNAACFYDLVLSHWRRENMIVCLISARMLVSVWEERKTLVYGLNSMSVLDATDLKWLNKWILCCLCFATIMRNYAQPFWINPLLWEVEMSSVQFSLCHCKS